MTVTFRIEPAAIRGAFSLAEYVGFGFGQRDAEPFEGLARMAFCLDGGGYRTPVGVAIHQDGPALLGVLAPQVPAGVDLDAVRRHVCRVMSLDHDGTGYEAVGARDPVMARLQALAPGLRPPLFYSPYEAAVWAVLSARRPAAQMAALRASLSAAHGTTFTVAGRDLAALPTPAQLLAVATFPGLPEVKLDRMHAIARAAQDGRMDVDHLRDLGPEAASAELQKLPGIGPFYASLIVIRATGFTDIFPAAEPRLLGSMRRLYALEADAEPSVYEKIADAWAPFRTWCAVLIRAAASRVP